MNYRYLYLFIPLLIFANIVFATPTVTIESPANATNTSSSLLLNFTTWDPVAVDKCFYELDGAANVTIAGCANSTSLSGLSDGAHTVKVWSNDTSSNNGSATRTFTVDTTGPTVTIQSPMNATNTSSSLLLNFTAWDISAASTCKYQLDAGANTSITTCANSTSLSGLSEGFHSLNVWVNDTYGNAASAVRTFTVDTTGPTVTIQSPANATNTSSSLLLNFTGWDISAVSTCKYQLDAGANTSIASCNNSTSLFGLSEGVHTVNVWVNDTYGNAASALRSFTVDTTGPTVTIQSPANATNTSSSLLLNFTAWDISTVSTCKYQLDAGANTSITSCANSTSLSGLSEGAHSLNVWVNDTYGNAASAIRSFTVDTTGTTVTIESPMNATNASSTILLNFTTWDISVIDDCQYELDGAANVSIASCANSTSLSSLSNAPHTVKVWVNDSFNNWGSATRSFTVDTIGPVVTIESPANATNTSSTLLLNFTAWDISAVDDCQYELDGAANVSIASCSNGTSLSSLSNAPHVIKVWINDTYGNLNVTSRGFTVDTIGPTVTIQSPANATNTSSSLLLNFTAWDISVINSCKYQLDAGVNTTITSCANSTSLSGLSEGFHSLNVWVNDTYGNAASAMRSFTVDTTGPIVTIQSPGNSTSTTSTVFLNFTAWDISGVSSCKYELDGITNVSIENCQNNTLLSLGNAIHTLKVWVNDTYNNWNSISRVFTIAIPLTTTTVSNEAGGTYKPSIPAQITNIVSLSPNIESSVKIDVRLGVNEVKLEVTEATDVQVIAKRHDTKPAEVTAPSPTVYKYVEITSNVAIDKLTAAKIAFNVTKSWLISNSVSADQVRLMRYNTTWQTLETRKVSESSDEVKYEAVTPGFSVFAITVEQSPAIITAITTTTIPTTTISTTSIKTTTVTTTTATTIIPILTTVALTAEEPRTEDSIWLLLGLLIMLFLIMAYLYLSTRNVFWNKKKSPTKMSNYKRRKNNQVNAKIK